MPSLPPRLLCSLAAAVVDNWHRDRAGARAGPYDHVSSFGVDCCELVELHWPRALIVEALGRLLLDDARVCC